MTNSTSPPQDLLSILPAPTTPVKVRERLVQMLRRDLVGAHPDLDPDLGQEVLQGTSPSTWYLTGFLFPHRETSIEKREGLVEEEQSELALEEQRATEGMEQGAAGQPTAQDQQSSEPPPRRSFEPSSIGLTVLLPRSATALDARVTWGDYVTEPPLESALVNPEEREEANSQGRALNEPARNSLAWRRLPRERKLTIPLRLGASEIIIPESAAPAYPGGALKLTVLVRETHTAGIDGKQRDLFAVSVFLVNRRNEALRRYGDLAACFQARLQLDSAIGVDCH